MLVIIKKVKETIQRKDQEKWTTSATVHPQLWVTTLTDSHGHVNKNSGYHKIGNNKKFLNAQGPEMNSKVNT